MAVFTRRISRGRHSTLGQGYNFSRISGFDASSAGTYAPVATTDDSGHATPLVDPLSESKPRCIRLEDDAENSCWVQGREILQSIAFQTTMGVFIVLNAVVIGLETDLPQWHWLWDVLEHALLIIFTLELAFRIIINGPSQYFDVREGEIWWNLFDMTVVGMGIFDAVASCAFPNVAGGGGETLFRIIRLLRILRIFRIVRFLKQLYLLAFGFIEAAQAVFWVTLLMASTLYVCSIILVRTVGRVPHEDPNSELLHAHFGTISVSMFTLFEIMANPELDGYEGALEMHPILGAFMIGFIIFGSFGMLALLTGVISESMFEKNQLRLEEERLERETKRKVLEKRCGELFDHALRKYSKDGAAIEPNPEEDILSSSDIAPLVPMIAELFGEVGVNFILADLEQLIDLMDLDGNGCISKVEFCHGIISIAEGVRPVSIMEIHHVVSIAKNKLERLLPVLTQMNTQSQELNESKKFILDRLHCVEESMKDLGQTFNVLHQQSKEIMSEKKLILDTMGELRDVVSQVKGDVQSSIFAQTGNIQTALETAMETVSSNPASLPSPVTNQLEKYISPVTTQLESYMSEVAHLRLSMQDLQSSQPARGTTYGVPAMEYGASVHPSGDAALVHQVQQCVMSLGDLKIMVKDSMSEFGSQLRELKKSIAAGVEGCLIKEAEASFSSPVQHSMPLSAALLPEQLPLQLNQVLSGLGELKSIMKGRDDGNSFAFSMPRSPVKGQADSPSAAPMQLPGQPPVQLSEHYLSGIGELKCMVQELQNTQLRPNSHIGMEEFRHSPTMSAGSGDMGHSLWNTAPAMPSTNSTRGGFAGSPFGENTQASAEISPVRTSAQLAHLRRLQAAGVMQSQVAAGSVGPPRDNLQADLPQQQMRQSLGHSNSLPVFTNLPRSPQHRYGSLN